MRRSTLFTSSMIRENDIPNSFLDSFELHYDEQLVTIDSSRDIDDLFDRNLLPPSSPVDGGSEEDSIIIDNEYAECLFKLNDEDDIDTSIVVVKDEDNSVILPPLTLGKKRKREYETRSKMRNKKLCQERDDNFWQELYNSHSVQEVRRRGARISIVLEKEYRI